MRCWSVLGTCGVECVPRRNCYTTGLIGERRSGSAAENSEAAGIKKGSRGVGASALDLKLELIPFAPSHQHAAFLFEGVISPRVLRAV